MGMDMTIDVFADQSYGQVALKKIASDDPNFRLFEAGWLGNGQQRDVMEVKGGVFRAALSGINKGKLAILVPDTTRTAYVTSQEMTDFKAASNEKK